MTPHLHPTTTLTSYIHNHHILYHPTLQPTQTFTGALLSSKCTSLHHSQAQLSRAIPHNTTLPPTHTTNTTHINHHTTHSTKFLHFTKHTHIDLPYKEPAHTSISQHTHKLHNTSTPPGITKHPPSPYTNTILYDSILNDSLVHILQFQLPSTTTTCSVISIEQYAHTKLHYHSSHLTYTYTWLWWVWLERCRDGSYAVNALHNVGSLCMHCGVHCCLFHWFLGKCFLVEVHPYITCFCTFWQSAFSVTFES